MGAKLLLATLATAWAVAVVVAYFWVGAWVMDRWGVNAGIPYWIFAWMLYGCLAAVPFVVYEMTNE